uniref:Uncharacterized protein n=1 Tax=Anguilla anguilla TaxID=7936 RepID=A0A0E9WEB7_ANGAN
MTDTFAFSRYSKSTVIFRLPFYKSLRV